MAFYFLVTFCAIPSPPVRATEATGSLSGIGGYRVRMLRRVRYPSVAVALALCGLLTCATTGDARPGGSGRTSSAAPLGGINIDGLSYNSQPAEADQAIAVARRLHAKVVRVELPWAVMEPRGPDQVDPRALAFADRLVADAASAGMTVIATALGTPCWASSAPASLLRGCSTTRPTQSNAWPPSDPASFAAFVGFLAQRYGTRLAAIEIWNEPDQANELYFAGPNKATRYGAVLRAAYVAIKRANANVPVLAGSLVGANGVFLRALYAAGIKGYYDGLAVHFYTLTLGSLRAIREVQLANGDTKALWLDEFGWSSCWPRFKTQEEQACVTRRVQAANITDIYRSLARTPYIAAVVLYRLPGSVEEDFGVVNQNGTHKPAFSALARALSSPFGRPSPVILRLRRRGRHIIASGSAPVGDFMQLEADVGNVLRYRALFTLDRFNRYSLVLPAALGTRGLRVRVYQYWAGPSRAAQRRI
jgi:polysaccharide biosynthesis protein PslG